MMFRKKSPLQRARKRFRKRRFFDRRSIPERVIDALFEATKPSKP
jgi:hypothetical protein